MSSIIASMIARLFPTPECRVLMVGLDAAGKTTILYKLRLGEVVTTIPTIGFNVETVEFRGVNFTFWDVGGCDKIRPLWRHYYQNTQAIIFVVDSNDRERMATDYESGIKELIHSTLHADELRDAIVLFYFNKQDLPNAASATEIVQTLKLDQIKSHRIHWQTCYAPQGVGLYEGLDWLVDALKNANKPSGVVSDSAAQSKKKDEASKPLNPEEEAAKRLEDLMVEWLEREDESDDDFLSSLENFTLQNWDHRTHLRIAWLILTRHGRQVGLPKIFDLIKNFIANSPRTQRSRGTTFHETMTYFWVHMVHYAIVATKLPKQDFKTFLLMNPQLCNGGLFLHYYTKQRMLHDPDARTMVLLPDKLPLPSIVGGSESGGGAATTHSTNGVSKLVPKAPLTDEQFLVLLGANELPGWGHDVKMRAIYLLLCKYGRSSASVDHILDTLSKIEKINTHLTINYFWIQMMTYHILSEIKESGGGETPATVFNAFNNKKYTVPPITEADGGSDDVTVNNLPFARFIQLTHCQALRNQLLYEKYYSRNVIDDKAAETSLILPNLKPFPKFI